MIDIFYRRFIPPSPTFKPFLGSHDPHPSPIPSHPILVHPHPYITDIIRYHIDNNYK